MITMNILPFIAGIHAVDETCKRLAVRINEWVERMRLAREKRRIDPREGFEIYTYTPHGEIQARPLFDGKYELWVYCGCDSNSGWALKGTVHASQVVAAVKNLQRPVIVVPATAQPKGQP